jgi:hypothetical protein
MHIIEIIGTLVDRMRETAAITNIVDNTDGTYTITADPKTLANGDYVTITGTVGFNNPTDQTDVNSAGYMISNVTSTTFDITKTSGTAIPGTFGTWKANEPYFEYGRWIEVDQELAQKEGSTKYRSQLFDLVYLQIPITETRDRTNVNSKQLEVSLKMYFFTETEDDENTKWRNDNKKQQLLTLEGNFLLKLKGIANSEIISDLTWVPFDTGIEFRFSTPVDALEVDYGTINIDEIC